MIHILLPLFAWLTTLALVVGALWFGGNISFGEQWPLYEALRTTAAIIFAVVGAWLAIVYPDRLRLSLGGNREKAAVAGERFNQLFTPVAHSTAILCIVLLVGILAPMLRQCTYIQANVELARALSFALLTALTLWQVWTVVLTLVPADLLKRKAGQEAAAHTSTNAVRGLSVQVSRDGDGPTH